jgi:hypothetical protein
MLKNQTPVKYNTKIRRINKFIQKIRTINERYIKKSNFNYECATKIENGD